MKIQDILRQLIDKLDGADNTEADAVDNVDHESGDVMIPPLQAKLELLKRATGVPNVYDEECPECGCSPCDCDHTDGYEHEDDELDSIKHLAGVPVTAIFTAGEDGPLEV